MEESFSACSYCMAVARGFRSETLKDRFAHKNAKLERFKVPFVVTDGIFAQKISKVQRGRTNVCAVRPSREPQTPPEHGSGTHADDWTFVIFAAFCANSSLLALPEDHCCFGNGMLWSASNVAVL
jgi:hypothetical protein